MNHFKIAKLTVFLKEPSEHLHFDLQIVVDFYQLLTLPSELINYHLE